MTNLITIHSDENGQAVSARELHEKLGCSQDFTNWFKYQADRIGLQEGLDFTPILAESTGGRPSKDYIVPLDIAKHLAMVSGGENAHMLREYFIAVEKQWNSPDAVMARALKMADKKLLTLEGKVSELEQTIEQQKPMVLFAESCIASNDSLLVREVAKLASKKGVIIGEKRLWQKLREWEIVSPSNEPYQKAFDAEWFEVKRGTYNTPYGTETYSTFLVRPKGQVYIIEKLKKELHI